MSGFTQEQKSLVEATRPKRRLYRELRERGMARHNAAIVAGYSTKLAFRRGRPVVNVNFDDEFEQKGMTVRKTVDECLAGMNATKVVSVRVGFKEYEQEEVPDWNARYKYFRMMMELRGYIEKESKKENNIFIIGSLASRIKKAREAREDQIRVNGARESAGKVIIDADYIPDEENPFTQPMRSRKEVMQNA